MKYVLPFIFCLGLGLINASNAMDPQFANVGWGPFMMIWGFLLIVATVWSGTSYFVDNWRWNKGQCRKCHCGYYGPTRKSLYSYLYICSCGPRWFGFERKGKENDRYGI